jgi:hypothetical protein
MLEANDPIFFSTDQLFMSLGDMRIFKMARLNKSLAGQKNDLGSDILSRYVMNQ